MSTTSYCGNEAGLGSTPVSSVIREDDQQADASFGRRSADAVDSVIEHCRQWVGWQSEINQLQLDWARLEGRLAKQHQDFFKLGDDDRGNLPGGERMAEIDSRIRDLYDLRNRALPHLATLRAQSICAVLAKLDVVTALLYPDEFPEAHKMVADSVIDLTRLWPTTDHR